MALPLLACALQAMRDCRRGGTSLQEPRAPPVGKEVLSDVHELQLTVLASAFPWRGGQARAIAQLFVQQCDEFFNCEQVTGSTNVKIRIRGGGE
jgi:hypothetical protein